MFTLVIQPYLDSQTIEGFMVQRSMSRTLRSRINANPMSRNVTDLNCLRKGFQFDQILQTSFVEQNKKITANRKFLSQQIWQNIVFFICLKHCRFILISFSQFPVLFLYFYFALLWPFAHSWKTI